MKVLFCLPGNEWGGPDREPVRTLERALTATGRVDVSFIQFSRDAKEIIRDKNRTLIPCRNSLSRSMLDGFRTERRAMADEIRRQKPDLLHVHWTQLGHALAAMDSGIPYVVTVHDAALACAYWNWSWNPPSVLTGLGGLLITHKVLRRAKHIIAVSPYVAEHVQRFFLRFPYSAPAANCISHSAFRIPHSVVSIIPNPVSLHENSGFRVQDSNGSPVFAAIGHWGSLKRFDLVLRAFSLVRHKIPSSKLVLVGKDLGRETPCHAWALRRGLDVGVIFRGLLSHSALMACLHSEMCCLVHPSRTEGFPLGVTEAMACGVRVIVSDAGGMPWMLENGKFGTIIFTHTPQVWAEAMIDATTGNDSTKLVMRGIGRDLDTTGISANPIPGSGRQLSMLQRARERIAILCDPLGIAAQHLKIYTRIHKCPVLTTTTAIG